MSAIFRILTDQNKINENIDLANKELSFFFLSSAEINLIRLRNRHRIHRNRDCIFCGEDLNINSNKTGKIKNCCNADCRQLYRLFSSRLEMIISSDHYSNRLKNFAEYCQIQMLFRVPAKRLNELLNASKKKQVISVKVKA